MASRKPREWWLVLVSGISGLTAPTEEPYSFDSRLQAKRFVTHMVATRGYEASIIRVREVPPKKRSKRKC